MLITPSQRGRCRVSISREKITEKKIYFVFNKRLIIIITLDF